MFRRFNRLIISSPARWGDNSNYRNGKISLLLFPCLISIITTEDRIVDKIDLCKLERGLYIRWRYGWVRGNRREKWWKKEKEKAGTSFVRTKIKKEGRKRSGNGQPVYLCIYLLSKFYWPPGRDNGAAKTSGGPQGDNSRPATANCDDSFYPATSSIRLRRTSRHDKSVSRWWQASRGW